MSPRINTAIPLARTFGAILFNSIRHVNVPYLKPAYQDRGALQVQDAIRLEARIYLTHQLDREVSSKIGQ